jgi:hypothetical protein
LEQPVANAQHQFRYVDVPMDMGGDLLDEILYNILIIIECLGFFE